MSSPTIRPTASAPQPRAPTSPPAAAPTAPVFPDSLLRPFGGKFVRIRLINGEELAGQLALVGKFELLLETPTEGQAVIFKNAVAWVTSATRPG